MLSDTVFGELPRSDAIRTGRITCVVSDSHRLLVPLIAKNATSTLRAELAKEEYGSYECLWSALTSAQKRYQTFAVIRDPLGRFLSGYYEVTLRTRNGTPPLHDFIAADGGISDVYAFVEHIRTRGFFDSHIETQSHYLEPFTVGEMIDVQALDSGVDGIRSHCLLGSLNERLPKLRPRNPRSHPDIVFDRHDLPVDLLRDIEAIYAEDIDLYAGLFGRR